MVKMINTKVIHRGNDVEDFLGKLTVNFDEKQITEIAEKGLEKFKENTPSDSGLTRESWVYEIKKNGKNWVINYNNTNIQNGMNVALLIENGHATPSGKWISGKPYIDKTLKEIQKDLDNRWEVLTKV